MTSNNTNSNETSARMISVRLQLESGHTLELSLSEDSPELATLFRILASRGSDIVVPAEQFLQLPLENGRAACSFHSRQLVSIITEPPVVIQLQADQPSDSPELKHEAEVVQPPVVINTPRHMIIDDFLSPDELRDMLDFAFSHEDQFEAGTVMGKASAHRQNSVIMNFSDTEHARLLSNRLLTWLPLLNKQIDIPLFPVGMVESQLTANNDGHYYRLHCDSGPDSTNDRALTCVYYFFAEPRPFSGGALRLYDSINQGDQHNSGSSYQEIKVVSNRLVVFPSSAFHELMTIRCPSGQFSDSRFAVTNWIHANAGQNPDETFGWGHLHCGVVPPQLNVSGEVSK